MAFAPVSPLVVDGLAKFLSLAYHRMIESAIFTFVDLNLADLLVNAPFDRGLTVDEIINKGGQSTWNKEILYRILRPCIDAGIVERVNDDKHFVLTESGAMLTSNHLSHARDLIKLMLGPEITSTASQLSSLARGEGPSGTFLTYGVDLYTLLSRPDQKEYLDTFNGAMTAFTLQTGDRLVSAIDFGRFETLVDIGGNRGTFMAQILQYYPSVKHGITFDLLQVINEVNNGEEFELQKISKDRYTFVAGSMFDSSTIPQADAYLIKHVLHNHTDEKVKEALSAIRQANESSNRKTVTVFIVEYIILADGAVSNWQSHAMDVTMASTYGSAKERTSEEFQYLLEQSGFHFKQLYPVQAPTSLIEAVFTKA